MRGREGGTPGKRSDAALLAAVDDSPEAFGAFYERHAEALLSYLLRLTGNRAVALEVTAEVFATALRRSRRYRTKDPSARGWLIDIALETLAASYRLHAVKATARRRLGVTIDRCDAEDWAQVEARMREATSGPLHDATHRTQDASVIAALRRRVSRAAR